MKAISTQMLAEAFINAHYGWAVADQFYATFEGEPFEKQNPDALKSIAEALLVLTNSNVLSVPAASELQSYYKELISYINRLPIQ